MILLYNIILPLINVGFLGYFAISNNEFYE